MAPTERTPWFERAFRFDLPPANFRDVWLRLSGTPLRLGELCRGVAREPATRHPHGTWSLQENVGHLLDLEPLWRSRTEELLAGAARLSPADLENRRTHAAGHDRADLADLVAQFETARGDWLQRLDGLGAEDFARAALHPRLQQPMRLVDLCVFVAEHDDHHLARIWELKHERA
jgi:uncharacterized damage-inducible protein DinB